jgi:Cys-tRNA(Pro)/Cys-tRNA(Cys) deacylase
MAHINQNSQQACFSIGSDGPVPAHVEEHVDVLAKPRSTQPFTGFAHGRIDRGPGTGMRNPWPSLPHGDTVETMAAKRSKTKSKGASTQAMVALHEAGIPFAVHEYRHDPDTTAYGAEAAKALSLDPQRVFKTLVADADGTLVVAIVPVSGQLSLKALASAVGAKRAVMGDPKAVEKSTGYVLGGISPIGQRKALPTILDISALDHSTVFVSGGRRGLDLELKPDDLISATRARTAPIQA